MKEAIETAVKKLADKAETADKPLDAMQFAQAALNLAQAFGTLGTAKR